MIYPLINPDIYWKDVCKILSITPDKPILPAQTACPLENCGGKLTIYNDTGQGGQWYRCLGCGARGDMLHLLSSAWKLDVFDTLRRAVTSYGLRIPAEKLSNAKIARNFQRTTARYNLFYEFWQKARRRLVADDSMIARSLLRKLGLKTSLTDERLFDGPAKFIGVTDIVEMEGVYKSSNKNAMGNLAKADRVAIGTNWADVLVIPFYDLPGRIKSCLYIGREASFPEDYLFLMTRWSTAFRREYLHGTPQFKDYDAGLALWEASDHTTKAFGDSVFAMFDPLLALRLHCQHFKDHESTLPLVSAYIEKSYRTKADVWWQMPGPIIFMGAGNNKEMFRHAAAVNGRVSTIGFTAAGEVDKAHTLMPPKDWLKEALETAQPWQAAMERSIASMSVNDAEDMLAGLETTQEGINRFLSRCSIPLQERYRNVMSKRLSYKITMLREMPVVERNNEWHEDKFHELICSAVLRIDRVIHNARTRQNYYIGRILYKDYEVPFEEDATVVEEDVFRWMRAKVLAAGLGLVIYDQDWTRAGLSLAVRFQEPKVYTDVTGVGWNKENRCFILPSYSIGHNGVVTFEKYITTTKRVPGVYLPAPGQLSGGDIDEINKHPAACLFWALTTAVAANVIAPAIDYRTAGIALVGKHTYESARHFIESLGCVSYTGWTLPYKDEGKDTLDMLCGEHGWPIYLETMPALKAVKLAWLKDIKAKNCIMPADWLMARSLEMNSGWYTIERQTQSIINRPLAPGFKVLPSFLQYASEKRFAMSPKKSFLNNINSLIADWYAEQGGKRRLVRSAMRLISNSAGHKRAEQLSSAFMLTVCQLHDEGLISIGDKPLRSGISRIYLHGDDRLVISKANFNNILASNGALPVDTAAITAALAKTGILISDQTFNDIPAWEINRNVFNKCLEEFHERGTKWRRKNMTANVTASVPQTPESC